MADAVKDAVKGIVDRTAEVTSSEPTPNLQLDEVTGEKVSKTERMLNIDLYKSEWPTELSDKIPCHSEETPEAARSRGEEG